MYEQEIKQSKFSRSVPSMSDLATKSTSPAQYSTLNLQSLSRGMLCNYNAQ